MRVFWRELLSGAILGLILGSIGFPANFHLERLFQYLRPSLDARRRCRQPVACRHRPLGIIDRLNASLLVEKTGTRSSHLIGTIRGHVCRCHRTCDLFHGVDHGPPWNDALRERYVTSITALHAPDREFASLTREPFRLGRTADEDVRRGVGRGPGSRNRGQDRGVGIDARGEKTTSRNSAASDDPQRCN